MATINDDLGILFRVIKRSRRRRVCRQVSSQIAAAIDCHHVVLRICYSTSHILEGLLLLIRRGTCIIKNGRIFGDIDI